MPSTYADFQREPSMPHQCMHSNPDSGRRCRGRAMHDNYMCFAHRDNVIPPVIENDPFEITHLANRAAIQQALAGVAARLACNRIDLKRAGILVYTLQVAACNLGAPPLAEEFPPEEIRPEDMSPQEVSPDGMVPEAISLEDQRIASHRAVAPTPFPLESEDSAAPVESDAPVDEARMEAAREEFRALTLRACEEPARPTLVDEVPDLRQRPVAQLDTQQPRLRRAIQLRLEVHDHARRKVGLPPQHLHQRRAVRRVLVVPRNAAGRTNRQGDWDGRFAGKRGGGGVAD